MSDDSKVLGKYKGLPVTGTSIVVNKLGDGLSKAVGIEPVVIGADERAYLAVLVTKTKDRYDLVRNDEGKAIGYVLVQVFDSQMAIFVDGKAVAKEIDTMRERIRKAEEEAKGVLSFELEGDDEVTDLANARAARNKHKELADKVDKAFNE